MSDIYFSVRGQEQFNIIFFSKVKVKVVQLCPTIQSLKFSRQEYWSGQPIPSPADLPNPGIQLGSPALQEESSFFLWKKQFFSQRANTFFLYCFKQPHFSIMIRNTEIYFALFQTFLFSPIKIHLGFLGGSAVKEFICNGDVGLIPGLGRSPEGEKQQPTPVFLPGKSHGQRSLEGYSPQGCKEVKHD